VALLDEIDEIADVLTDAIVFGMTTVRVLAVETTSEQEAPDTMTRY
jgi:hypothetical protein